MLNLSLRYKEYYNENKKVNVDSNYIIVICFIRVDISKFISGGDALHPSKLAANHKYLLEYPFEEITLQAKDGESINGILIKSATSKGLVYYSHGNSGNVQDWTDVANDFISRGYDLFLYDFRGFGKSTGKISEENMYSDGQLLYDHLKQNYSEDSIIIYGRSMGTSVASYLASKNKPVKLILETPYYSMPSLVSKRMPFLPARLLLRYELPVYKFLKSVNCPIHIIHGTNDNVVYYSEAKKLVTEIPAVVLTTIEGGNHNNLPDSESYQEKLRELLP